MTDKLTIEIPEDILFNAVEEGRNSILIYKPENFDGQTDVRLQMKLSGREFDLENPSVKSTKNYDELKKKAAILGAEDLSDLLSFTDSAYTRSEMYPDRSGEREFLQITWKSLKPVAGENLPDPSTPSVVFPRGHFYSLFFVKGSEAWLAEQEHRTPVPWKTGTIRAGDRDWKPGPLRLVEIDGDQKPTGWEAEATVSEKGGLWHGPLSKLPLKFAKASGFDSRKEAITGMFNIYAEQGRKLDKNSPMTAVIFAPVQKDKVKFRP